VPRLSLGRLTRNFEAPALFESFFVAAVTSFLGIRAFLAVTGYPRIGSAGIHIAHMLWGGLLMLAALVLLLGYLDRSVREVPFAGDGRAVVGGAGSIWLSTDAPEQLVEIDPGSATIKRVIRLSVTPRTFAISGDAAWIVADTGALEGVDFATGQVRTYDFGRPIQSLALGGAQLWLTVR